MYRPLSRYNTPYWPGSCLGCSNLIVRAKSANEFFGRAPSCQAVTCERKTYSPSPILHGRKNFMSRRLYYSGRIALVAFYENRRNCPLLYRLSKNNVAFFCTEYDPQTHSIEKFKKNSTSYFFICEMSMHMMKTRTFRALNVIHEIRSLFNSSGLSRKWCKHEWRKCVHFDWCVFSCAFQVGMERRDVILTAVFGTVGALAILIGLALAMWLYLRARKSKQQDDDLEDQNENGEGSSQQQQPTKKNGFLNLKTPLISTKALGWAIVFFFVLRNSRDITLINDITLRNRLYFFWEIIFLNYWFNIFINI